MTVISKRVISKRQPQGIGKPVALRAFLTSFYSFSYSHSSKMPCGTALSAVASEPFLSHLGVDRNGSAFKTIVIRYLEERVHIISNR